MSLKEAEWTGHPYWYRYANQKENSVPARFNRYSSTCLQLIPMLIWGINETPINSIDHFKEIKLFDIIHDNFPKNITKIISQQTSTFGENCDPYGHLPKWGSRIWHFKLTKSRNSKFFGQIRNVMEFFSGYSRFGVLSRLTRLSWGLRRQKSHKNHLESFSNRFYWLYSSLNPKTL